MQVDDFIDSPSSDAYASFVLHLFRLPALQAARWERWTSKFRLFCKFDGKRYRVTGASRLGDVWLHGDWTATVGYEHRVDVEKCSEWGPEP
jgi:hypothetical protein